MRLGKASFEAKENHSSRCMLQGSRLHRAPAAARTRVPKELNPEGGGGGGSSGRLSISHSRLSTREARYDV
jgi:hypothetical protein